MWLKTSNEYTLSRGYEHIINNSIGDVLIATNWLIQYYTWHYLGALQWLMKSCLGNWDVVYDFPTWRSLQLVAMECHIGERLDQLRLIWVHAWWADWATLMISLLQKVPTITVKMFYMSINLLSSTMCPITRLPDQLSTPITWSSTTISLGQDHKQLRCLDFRWKWVAYSVDLFVLSRKLIKANQGGILLNHKGDIILYRLP